MEMSRSHPPAPRIASMPPPRSTPSASSATVRAGNAAGLTRVAFFATLHCLLGCAVGEVLGMVVGTALGWSNAPTMALAVVLAFMFGYAFTYFPLRRAGLARGDAARVALQADTASIALMEVVDNAVMMAVPGAMDATLDSLLFWGALALSLAMALVMVGVPMALAYPCIAWGCWVPQLALTEAWLRRAPSAWA